MAVLNRVWFVGVLLLTAASVLAQGPGKFPPGRPPEGGGPQGGPPAGGLPPLVMLAAQKSVQADLKCTKSQKKRIQALVGKMREAADEAMQAGPQGMGGGPQGIGGPQGMRGGPQGMRGGPRGMGQGPQGMGGEPQGTQPGDQGAQGGPQGIPPGPQGMPPPRHGMGGKMDAARKDAEKELAEILSAEQMTRLKQIAMQLQGLQAVLAPETAEKLQLTKEQVSKIQGLTRKQDKKLNTILTDDQRAKWQGMTGRPFHGKITAPPPGAPMARN